MSYTIIVHINNEDAVMGEVQALPTATDQLVSVQNPRRKDGKDLHYLDEEVNTMIVPMHRINFIQVLPSGDVDEVIGFIRE
ncbi:MAG: hypothetical protein IPL28_01585 [Chloroflexi bacterium]|nr:hypothetical protein [Chloroflexota bacterium]MDA0245691.1 hypothetical protein [Chloroflexota bacterium]